MAAPSEERRRSTQKIVDCLQNEYSTGVSRRTPARHSRPSYPSHAASGKDAWARHRKAHRADFRGPAPGRNRIVVSGAAPAGGSRLDRGPMGTIGKRKASEILPPDD